MRLRRLAAAAATALMVPLCLFAQEQEPAQAGRLLHVTTWEVQPDQAADFEFVAERIAEAARRVDLTPYRWVWYADAGRYTLVAEVESFAEFDDPTAFWRALTGPEVEPLLQEAHATFGTVNARVISDEVFERLGDRSYEVQGFDPGSDMRFIQVQEVWPRPNMEAALEELDRKWIALYSDLGYPYPYDTYSVSLGVSRMLYVTFIDDLSKFFGENDFRAMVGRAGMTQRLGEMHEQYVGIIDRWDHSILVFKSEMSYWPTEQPESN